MKVSPFRWILLVFVILTSLLQGHLIDQIFSEWEYEENSGKWILKIQFDAGYADPVRRYDADVPAPNYKWLVACEPEEWTILQREARRYLGKHLLFKDETTGASLPYEVSFPDWNETPPAFPKRLNGQAYFHVLFVGRADAEPSINIAPGRFPDLVVAEGEVVRTIIGPGESVVASEGNQSLLGGFWVWLVEGFRHVLPLGWDHVLFILGLFLFRREWRPLLLQSLMFTIAHTLTLVMAATGVGCLAKSPRRTFTEGSSRFSFCTWTVSWLRFCGGFAGIYFSGALSSFGCGNESRGRAGSDSDPCCGLGANNEIL